VRVDPKMFLCEGRKRAICDDVTFCRYRMTQSKVTSREKSERQQVLPSYTMADAVLYTDLEKLVLIEDGTHVMVYNIYI